MARNYSNLASSRSEYARALPGTEGGFRGVDFSSSPHRVALYRLPDLQNMYRDYRSEEGGALETIPGFRRIAELSGRINGLYRYDTGEGVTYVAAHAGEGLYLCREDERDAGEWVRVGGSLADAPSKAFVYNNALYLLDGKTYQKVAEQDGAFSLISVMGDPYVPKTYYMGEQYEQRNLLTDRYSVGDLGSAGVEATPTPESDYGMPNVNGGTRYLKSDSFLYAYRNYTGYYYDTSAKFVVFGNDKDGGGENTIGERPITASASSYNGDASSVDAVAVLATSEDITIEDNAFDKYENITSFYFGGSKKIHVPSDSVLTMKRGGRIYFPWKEDDSRLRPFENYVKWLPPNVVVRRGAHAGTRVDQFRLRYDSVYATPSKSDEVQFSSMEPATSSIAANSICFYNQGDGIVCKAGENVALGRYYASCNLRLENGLIKKVFYRIEVVEGFTKEEDMPIPVQDVYGYDAVPRVFHLPEKTKEVLSVKDEDFDAAFGCFYDDDGNITAVGAMVRAGENEVTIEAVASDYHIKTASKSFFEANPDYKGTSDEAINGCTLFALYDDRVFLAGNPALPNTVFYSARNGVGVNDPSYFGALNYFNDGIGWEKITALFPFSDTLCVAKADNLYYHSGADGSDYVPRVYPSVRGNAGIGSLGACCSFLDDPVMLTARGVWGVNKETLTLERTLGRRSATIDARLLREEDLRAAQMAEWEGYLCLFVGGHVYMADSRSAYQDELGGVQYEWFFLSDVGVWRDENGLASPVYAAVTGELSVGGVSLEGATVTRNGVRYPLVQTHEEIFFTDAYSATVNGQSILYAIDAGRAYVVYATGELAKEGVFHPGAHPLVVGDRLYFGTDTGEVFVFNNDRRGVSVDGDEVEPFEIHHSFYSFAGHRIDSGLLTRCDDCGVPHLCKTTSSRSLILRVKLMGSSRFSVAVSTERKRDRQTDVISASPFDLGGLDFASISFLAQSNATVVASERERRWVEKQYLLRDGGYCRPFGIYNLTYRYRIAGRIRE